MSKIKIGIIGLGTVGSGVYKSLQDFDEVEIIKIAVRNINKPRSVDVPPEMWNSWAELNRHGVISKQH